MNFIKKTGILSLKEVIFLSGVFSLFFMPLVYVWMGVPFFISEDLAYVALGGVIPYSDATGYYTGAESFLRLGELNAWNMRRPLNALLFAVRLKLSDGNFQGALLMQAALCGLGAVFFARTVSRILGLRAAFSAVFICFLWALTYVPTTLSEPLGFFLGLLAMTLVIEGIYSEKSSLFGFGVFVLTVGLNARAGPFLILPFLFFWLLVSPIFKNRKIWLLFLVGGVVLGFVYTKALLLLYSEPKAGGQMNANFAATLYGLARGGLSWVSEYKALEGLPLTTENDQAIWLYKESLRLILMNPFDFIKALLLNLWAFIKFFLNIKYVGGFFSYPFDGISFIGLPIVLYYYFRCFKSFRVKNEYSQKIKNIALMGALGCFFSAALTFDSGGIRTFAVGIPFIALTLALPFSSPFSGPFSSPPEMRKEVLPKYSFLLLVSLIVLGAGLIFPLFIGGREKCSFSKGEQNKEIVQLSGEKIIKVCTLKNYPFLNIETDRSTRERPSISPKRFAEVANLGGFPLRDDLEELDLKAPCSLGFVFDEITHQFFLIAGPLGWFNQEGHKKTQTLSLKHEIGFDDSLYFLQKVT